MGPSNFRISLNLASVMVWVWLALVAALDRHWLRPSHFSGASGVLVHSLIEAIILLGMGGGAVLWLSMLWLWARKDRTRMALRVAWLVVIVLGIFPGAALYWWRVGRRLPEDEATMRL